jgi:hypothetical protein
MTVGDRLSHVGDASENGPTNPGLRGTLLSGRRAVATILVADFKDRPPDIWRSARLTKSYFWLRGLCLDPLNDPIQAFGQIRDLRRL